MSCVDVIVPCYRYGHYLRQCVRSVLDQSGCETRVLILDDASPDHTPAVAAELTAQDNRVTVRRHDTNMGHIATYNEGLAWATSKYQLLLSADDYLLPGALARASALLDEHSDVGFAFGDCLVLRADQSITTLSFAPGKAGTCLLSGTEFIRMSGSRNIVPTPTAVVRTSLQQRLGGYEAALPHTGDMEFWLRLASQAPVGIVLTSQAVYRRHAENMSLAYKARSELPDLQHRQSALEHFFRLSSPLLDATPNLRSSLLASLARDATHAASAAFNVGDMDTHEELRSFAAAASIDVKNSWPWAKLRIKRALGPRHWCALQTRLPAWLSTPRVDPGRPH